MPITLKYTETNQIFLIATPLANNILSSEDFFNMLANTPGTYDETVPQNLSPATIAGFFRNSNLVLNLRHYSRDASIGGAFDPRYPKTLWVNVNTWQRGCNYAAVLVHECVHALSFHTPGSDFSHDNDDSSLNQGTAPYAIQRATRDAFCNNLVEDKELAIVETKVNEKDIVD